MCVYAHILDWIDDIGEAFGEVSNNNLEPYMSFLLRCPEDYRTGQNRAEVLWRTLIWDFGITRPIHPASTQCEDSFHYWLLNKICATVRKNVRAGTKRSDCFRAMENLVQVAMKDPTEIIPHLVDTEEICDNNGVLEDRLDPDDDDELPVLEIPRRRASTTPEGSAEEFKGIGEFRLATLQTWENDPRIYRTRSGYMGSGPFSTQKGDVVVIIAGGRVPFVLRPVGPPPELKYRLLGDTYVHGIMHGEAMHSPGMEWKWLNLV
jgi:hypothetical protein